MAEDQPIIHPLVEKTPEKTLDSSVSSETPLTIPFSTTTTNDTPKPDSSSPSISPITPSDLSLPLSVENSETPKLDSFLSLSPEILTAQSKDREQKETTGTLLEGPDPSPEETGQGSSSQVNFDPAPSPHFDVEPLEILAPAMRSSDEEDQDNVTLYAFIAKKRAVTTPEPSPKCPTTRLQAKEALESALQKSKRSSKKKKKRLVKNVEVVCDKNIPVVDMDEEVVEKPSSLVKKS
ncbi:pectinesterase inhibitor 10-like [Nicotiana sylvestris]|uniref:pectinesterase inhibitor 10-like n=1 Tax=Nicotiana sylvestris TaxID=4096 RepID=UPI00388CE147